MKKKILIITFILLGIFALSKSVSNVKADSGWDSGYDSDGGYDSGGGGYDSGWSSGDSWSSGGSHSGVSGEANPLAVIIFFGIIIFVIVIINKNRGSITLQSGGPSKSINYHEVPDETLAKYNINPEAFKQMSFEIYENIQKAWMDFDYDELRKYTTDEIYNTYTMQLDALKIKKQKNIMSDFKFIEAKIIDVRDENGIINVDVYLNIEMYDYVVDQNNTVIRGKDNHLMNIEYIITFVKENKQEKDEEVICPNCGAKVPNAVTGQKCDYCGSIVVVKPRDYVMSKKTCINQRMR